MTGLLRHSPRKPATTPHWWSSSKAEIVAHGPATGISVASWSWDDAVYETNGAALADTHAMSFALDSLETEFTLDGRRAFSGAFAPGMLAVIPAGQRPWAVQSGAARKVHIYLPVALVAEAMGSPAHRPAPDIGLKAAGVLHDAAAAALCREVVGTIRDVEPGGTMLLDSLGLRLAVHAVRNWTGADMFGGAAPTRLSKPTCDRVIAYMGEYLADDISLAELAKITGLSNAHFCRAFRATTGRPPYNYLLTLRIAKARATLETTDLSIGDVAALVGYDDSSYFARLFKRHLGFSPHDYRLERRR